VPRRAPRSAAVSSPDAPAPLAARKIIHVDMDAFYASVEQRDRPELRGRPIAVGGDPRSRGVVAAASYEARRFGVRSAISCAQAQRLCPEIVFVRPNFAAYREASRRLHEILDEITPLIEPLSLDEAYLDVTSNALGEPLAGRVALRIKPRVRSDLSLTVSAGVGPNKFVAKIASDLRKPDGLVIVPPGEVLGFLAPLPVERLWGVGPATARALHELGLFKIADLRSRSADELERALGRIGSFVHPLAHGVDDRPVEPHGERKSRGSETTFERDVVDVSRLEAIVEQQAREIADTLIEMERPGRTVTLKLRYSDFTTITRSRTLPHCTGDAARIASTAIALLREKTEAGARPVRLIGVSMSGLLDPDEPAQLWLDLPGLP
jgi:DNA polymerase IV